MFSVNNSVLYVLLPYVSRTTRNAVIHGTQSHAVRRFYYSFPHFNFRTESETL